MSWYNKIADLEVNLKLMSWHFRVKIIRIYSYEVFGDGPFWSYILADEAGSKTEMVNYPSDARMFEGLEEQEGKWVEIFRVKVENTFTGFKPTNSPFRLSVIEGTRIKPIDPLNNCHYMDFKAIHEILYITNTDIPIDIMGVVFNVEPLKVCFADRKRTKMVFYIRDNIENQIKCVETGYNAYAFRDEFANTRGRGVVIVVINIWRICKYLTGDEMPWLETEQGLSDFRFNPRMKEVDDFREEVAKSDPYVARHGAIVPL